MDDLLGFKHCRVHLVACKGAVSIGELAASQIAVVFQNIQIGQQI